MKGAFGADGLQPPGVELEPEGVQSEAKKIFGVVDSGGLLADLAAGEEKGGLFR